MTSSATFIDRLRAGEWAAMGTLVFSPDPAVTEIAAAAGLDFVVVDTEHAPLGVRDVLNHLTAAQAAGITAFVRVGDKQEGSLIRPLDAGAAGIMIPHASDVEELASLRDLTRYSPEGSRPTCTGVRAAKYGIGDFSARADKANAEVALLGLIEDLEAADNIEAILDSQALDVVLPGPGDLAAAHGVPGKFDHPSVTASVDQIIDAAVNHHQAVAGMYVTDLDVVGSLFDRGVRFFMYSMDYKVLSAAYDQARSAVGGAVK